MITSTSHRATALFPAVLTAAALATPAAAGVIQSPVGIVSNTAGNLGNQGNNLLDFAINQAGLRDAFHQRCDRL